MMQKINEMQIVYQNTDQDYIEFYKLHYKKSLPLRLFILISLIVFGAFDQSKYHDITVILASVVVSFLVLFALFYFMPYFIVSVRLKRTLAKRGLLEDKILLVSNEGLTLTFAGNSTSVGWEKVKSVELTDCLIIIPLTDRKFFIIPKRDFALKTEIDGFLDLLQNNAPRLRWALMTTESKPKAPYSTGWLGLIPIVGGFVSIWLIINGVLTYKDRKLVWIGSAGLAFSIIISITAYFASQSNFGKKGFVSFAQNDLNTLMKSVEFYKLQNGAYPDSLEQVTYDNKFMSLYDPVQKEASKYNYQRVGDKYYLFSSGLDGIPQTRDDIYPKVAIKDSTKFGLIRH